MKFKKVASARGKTEKQKKQTEIEAKPIRIGFLLLLLLPSPSHRIFRRLQTGTVDDGSAAFKTNRHDNICSSMVKAKRRQLAALAAAKECLSADEASWVLVKKQKITILIPPLPAQPPPQTPRMKRVQTKTRKMVKGRSRTSSKGHCKDSLNKQNKSTVYAFNDGIKAIDSNVQAVPPDVTNEQLPSSTFKAAHEGPDVVLPFQPSLDPVPSAMNAQFIKNKQIQRTNKSLCTLSGGSRQHIGKLEAFKPSAAFKQKDSPLQINRTRDVNSFKSVSCLNIGALQNQHIRVLNVERKLKRAGGLSMWLISQGLGQFLHIFQKENIGKFQLLNLTMGKLRDMGANAVGPRRKLIHAIDCLCKPCYF